MNRRSFSLIAISMMAGCAKPIAYDTPSGRPERLFNAPPEKVRPALVAELVNRGYVISKESQSLVQGEKKAQNFGVNFAYGTGMDPQATVRTTFTIIPQGGQTRVVGDLMVVSNAGTAFERVHNFSNSQFSLDMQAALNRLQV